MSDARLDRKATYHRQINSAGGHAARHEPDERQQDCPGRQLHDGCDEEGHAKARLGDQEAPEGSTPRP